MSRPITYKRLYIPNAVARIVIDCCIDYYRRDREIRRSEARLGCDEGNNTPDAVIEEYKRLNEAVDEGVKSVESGVRKELFKDIVEGRGYQKSGLQVIMCKEAYYNRKDKVIGEIALNLKLI